MIKLNDITILLESKLELVNSNSRFKSIITKAIEFRAKECFNILLNHPNLKLLTSNESYGYVWKSGMAPALNYYGNAPNKVIKKDNVILYEKKDEEVLIDSINNVKFRDIILIVWKAVKTKSGEYRVLKLALDQDVQYMCPIYVFCDII